MNAAAPSYAAPRFVWCSLLAVLLAVGSGCSDADNPADTSANDEAASGASISELAGEWTLTIDTPRGVAHPVLLITATDSGYAATYKGRQGLLTIDEVTRDGNRFAFPLSITVPIGTIEVSYQGVIDGDRMTGVVANPRGEVPFSGERTKP